VLAAAVAWGLAAETLAVRYEPSTSYAGAYRWALALELAAGWCLIGAGVALRQLRPALAAGPLAAAAGFVWFAPNLSGWEGGPTLVRSIGMVAAGFWLPLLAHAVLSFPHRRLPSPATSALIAALYAETTVVAVGRALFRDPFADVNCWDNCLANSFLVHSSPDLTSAVEWVDLRFAIAFASAFIVVAARQLAAATQPARRVVAPVFATGAAVVGVHAAAAVALLGAPLEDPYAWSDAVLFAARCLAATALAFALAWTLVKSRHARRAVEQLSMELCRLGQPGALEAALRSATGDASLTIAYRRRDRERYVDGAGRDVPPPAPSTGRALTTIRREGVPVAVVDHEPVLLDDAFATRIGSAARLAVDNERLRAEALAQVAELRASRARIVAASDALRRGLERDLHDGAQQRLISLAFALRVALNHFGPKPSAPAAHALADAERALAAGIEAVRAIAHGLFPATLARSGLAFALEELAELAPIPIDVRAVPRARLPPAVEAAAYEVIREAVDNAGLHARASAVSISASTVAGNLVVEAADDGIGGADPAGGVGLLDAADRVGALSGSLTIVSPTGGGTRIEAVIPCG